MVFFSGSCVLLFCFRAHNWYVLGHPCLRVCILIYTSDFMSHAWYGFCFTESPVYAQFITFWEFFGSCDYRLCTCVNVCLASRQRTLKDASIACFCSLLCRFPYADSLFWCAQVYTPTTLRIQLSSVANTALGGQTTLIIPTTTLRHHPPLPIRITKIVRRQQ